MTDQKKTEAELEADVERDRSAWADECTLPLMGQSIYRKANAAGSYAQSCEALINHLKTSRRDYARKAFFAAADLYVDLEAVTNEVESYYQSWEAEQEKGK